MKKGLKVLILLFVLALTMFFAFSCGGDSDTTTTTDDTTKTSSEKATVTLDADGGLGLSEGRFTVRLGRKISESKLPELTKIGYVFDGWFTEDGEKWDLSNKVEEDIKLIAHWSVYVCPHEYSVIKTVKATCDKDGYTREECSLCFDTKDTPIAKLGHSITPDYVVGVKATDYAVGTRVKKCTRCTYVQETILVPALKDLSTLDIDTFKYTGGSYNNQIFIDIAKYAGVEASSVYTICNPLQAIDGNLSTVWQPDTLVDGGNFTGEWIKFTFEEEQTIGGVSVSMPNYKAWNIGDGCYQAFDVEALVNGTWTKVGNVSDKNVNVDGLTAVDSCTFTSPVTTKELRLKVSYSGRYNPAQVKEVSIYAYNADVYRTAKSLYTMPVFTTTPKFNEWATGADKINDGNNSTYWHGGGQGVQGGDVYIIATYPSAQYIAYVTWITSTINGREFTLEYWNGSAWESLGDFSGKTSYSVEVNKRTDKFKLTFKSIGQWWDCYINDFEAFTVTDTTMNVDTYSGCFHKLTDNASKVETKPTCDTAGYTTIKCKSCDYTYKIDATDALGHRFGEYATTQNASASSLGLQTATCSVNGCNVTKTRNIPKNNLEPATIANYYKNAPAAWCMTFDDGCYTGTIEWMLNKIQTESKYNDFKFTAVVTISMIESLKDKWDEYVATGIVDIGSHSYNHTGSYAGNAGPAGLYNDVNNAVYALMNMFPGKAILGFATPGGATSESAGNFITGLHAGVRNGGQSGGEYATLDQLNSMGRVKWGNLPSFVAKNNTTTEDCKRVIDEAIAANGWVIECNHAISGTGAGSDVITIDANVKKAQLDYLAETGVWVASFNDVIQYIKEAQNATVNVIDNTETQIKLTLTDTLDDYMFNFPLTIKVDIPSGWNSVSATQNGIAVDVFVEDGYAYVDAVPDCGEIVVTKN